MGDDPSHLVEVGQRHEIDVEDHAADEWRYACMSRPYTRPKPVPTEDIKGMEGLTLDRLWEESRRTGPSKRI